MPNSSNLQDLQSFPLALVGTARVKVSSIGMSFQASGRAEAFVSEVMQSVYSTHANELFPVLDGSDLIQNLPRSLGAV